MITDHRDRNGLNCTRANLRIATYAQNSSNIPISRRNVSGYKGVAPDRQHPALWRAEICAKNKLYRLGSFATAEEAARVYDAAARRLHGEFAYLNFPDQS